jgi:hypothetical protein
MSTDTSKNEGKARKLPLFFDVENSASKLCKMPKNNGSKIIAGATNKGKTG